AARNPRRRAALASLGTHIRCRSGTGSAPPDCTTRQGQRPVGWQVEAPPRNPHHRQVFVRRASVASFCSLPRIPVTEATLAPISPALLADADRLLLAPANLDLDKISRVLASIHAHDIDFADFYFQHSCFESWSLEEGIVKAGTFNIDSGVGVRAVSGDKQAFAYSDDISLAAL